MKKCILVVMVLVLLLTGCGNSDYNKAMDLYEAGNYEEAIVLFLELGDYEDSAEKVIACNYGIALNFYNSGDYATAMNLFTTLDDYEDSAEKALDCQYHIAVNAYESEDYATALNLFSALGDYSDSMEYRLEAAWKALHTYIIEHGEKIESTTKLSYVNKSGSGQIIQTDLAIVSTNPEQLILYNGNKIEVMGIMNFSDLAVTITRGNPEAQFQISTKLTGLGTENNTSGDGTFNISSATINTQLNPSNYLYYYTDIYGKSHSETEMDSTSRAALQEHYTYMIEGVSTILGQTGLGITLADLGFTAMG
ncbi:MAG: tetratricopeptide repeat protein [Oscillospiraceae bacterium]|nr:tetratricopeptide repeat protein [Oscillospiraceae bacterium]